MSIRCWLFWRQSRERVLETRGCRAEGSLTELESSTRYEQVTIIGGGSQAGRSLKCRYRLRKQFPLLADDNGKASSAFHPAGVRKWVAGKAKAGMAHSDCVWTCGCAGKAVKSLENTCHTWALLMGFSPCGLLDCKNRRAPFRGRMS